MVKIVILISGKRKSGKDYVASLLHTKLGGDLCSVLHLSGPLKQQYAQYKESYRADMIRWGEEKRAKDYGHFCRLIASGPGSEMPIWIISDARRRTDVQYFEEKYRHCDVIKVRVVATEEARLRRGWTFTPGIDDAESECDLDTQVKFDVVIDNSGDDKTLNSQLLDLLHSIRVGLND